MQRISQALLLLALSATCVGCPTSEGSTIRQRADADPSVRDRVDDISEDTSPDAGTNDESSSDAASDSDVTTEPEPLPPVAVAAEHLEGRVSQPVSFDASASTDPDGSIVAFDWDFGDGTSGSGAELQHTFSMVGEFEASISVEDDQGLTDVAYIDVVITADGNQPPVAVIGGVPEEAVVGDTVALDGSASADADGEIVSYEWAIRRSGSPSWQQEIGETVNPTLDVWGPHEIRLIVVDDQGAEGTALATVEVLSPPSAMFELPDRVEAGVEVTFDASDSHDPDGELTAFEWDFGDGEGATDQVVTRAYESDGVYDVSLTVTDDDGLTGVLVTSIVIGGPNLPPAADAGPDQLIALGTPVILDARNSTDDGRIVAYRWSFGDGESGFSSTTSHVYAVGGSYTVNLTIEDEGGLEDTDSATITVNTPPVAAFEFSAVPTVEVPVVFNAGASTDPDGDDIVSFDWLFGDGSSGSGAEVAHTYSVAGDYTVRLTIRDSHSATGLVEKSITVGDGTGSSVDGLWRVRANDADDILVAECLGWSLQVGPATCEVSGSDDALVMTCGSVVYSGTRSGDNFDVSATTLLLSDPASLDILDPNWDPFWFCGDIFSVDHIVGTFVSDAQFESTSSLEMRWEVEDPFLCVPCYYEDLPKTGRKL